MEEAWELAVVSTNERERKRQIGILPQSELSTDELFWLESSRFTIYSSMRMALISGKRAVSLIQASYPMEDQGPEAFFQTAARKRTPAYLIDGIQTTVGTLEKDNKDAAVHAYVYELERSLRLLDAYRTVIGPKKDPVILAILDAQPEAKRLRDMLMHAEDYVVKRNGNYPDEYVRVSGGASSDPTGMWVKPRVPTKTGILKFQSLFGNRLDIEQSLISLRDGYLELKRVDFFKYDR